MDEIGKFCQEFKISVLLRIQNKILATTVIMACSACTLPQAHYYDYLYTTAFIILLKQSNILSFCIDLLLNQPQMADMNTRTALNSRAA